MHSTAPQTNNRSPDMPIMQQTHKPECIVSEKTCDDRHLLQVRDLKIQTRGVLTVALFICIQK